MSHIVTFGEALLRWSKNDQLRLIQGSSFNGNFGGSEANVAVSLALLGHDVTYVSRLPQGLIAQACINQLRSYGIDTSHIQRGGERIGTYFFEASAAMRNSQVVYDRQNSSFYNAAPGMFPWQQIFAHADIFHTSGITCSLSPSATEATFEAVEEARGRGVAITTDINYRRNLWKYPGADPQAVLQRLLRHSRFVFGDQNEWQVASGLPIPQHHRAMLPLADGRPTAGQSAVVAPLTGEQLADYQRYFDRLHAMFPETRQMLIALRNQISTTHHTLTGLLWHEGQLLTTRIYDINPVIDPMGVGDAFVAAFIHAMTGQPGNPQFCLDFALAASQLKNSINGDSNLVTEQEILQQM